MKNTDQLIVSNIRILSAEMVQKSNSGHPGLPMGAAPMAYALWAKNMKHNPYNTKWIGRDRFVLSAGHGSALIYSLLHLFNYELSIEDLKKFRQWESKTPGHPEYGHTVGIETTTGPLGQGIANAVGMAMAEQYLAAKFNKPGFEIIDNYTFALTGDGCLMEGVALEAISLAGTLGLGKLILLYDCNNITIEGSTDIAFTEDVEKKFEACGWHAVKVEDGNDVDSIDKAIKMAKAEKEKPSIVIVKTQIGYGCPAKQGKSSAHGEPLGVENIKAAKEFLGWNYEEEFHVPDEVKSHLHEVTEQLKGEEEKWEKLKEGYDKEYPELSKELELWLSGKGAVDLDKEESLWSFEKPMATRASSGIIINKLASLVPNLIGGSADLAPSTKTYMEGKGDFSKENRAGANLHFGIREHAMAAIANGMTVYGGLKTFVATFFVFSDYMKGAMRLSALMKLPVVYVLTHDSIGVGEDGPTHEPIEQLASLRSIPNMTVYRPADSKETAAAWDYALTKADGPTCLVLTRQDLPLYKETGLEALKGAYILKDSKKDIADIILMATGSEVELIYKAAEILEEKGIDARVVSMPSLELFERQSEEYKEKILPKKVRNRLAVEAASSFGWHKYVGLDGNVISIDHFGASAPAKILFEEFGFTVKNVVEKALEIITKK
ncbi:transketolase [Clostridium polyendosporum]|uniref:Transketolase n=1 Tax=Clostridium polyendosporum TaxID=69208 RepID=A0A919VFP3_9CLOT|nr:transketolase [Clostridium polyendosporum]GIM27706.1 transketolase [Clostridium polyendosporum]